MGFSLMGSGKFGSGLLGMGLFGSEDEENVIPRPEYFEDPDYRETQDFLKEFGMNLLTGDIPDYYAPIGEYGGKEFEDVLQRTTAATTRGVTESLAKSGRARGGQLAASVAPAIADTEATMRYNDYVRAIGGRERLMGTGVGVTQGVRGAGEREGGRVNVFNWQDYEAQINERSYQDAKQAEEDAAFGQMLGTVASLGLGVATGGMSFGLQGALAGGLDAFTGGGTSFLSTLGSLGKAKKKTSQVGTGTKSLADKMGYF